MLKTLGDEFAGNFAELLAEVKAGNLRLDDLRDLLIAMRNDIGEIKADTKESVEIQKELLKAIKTLGADSAANFTKLINLVNDGKLELESLKGILKSINNYVKHIDSDVHDLKDEQILLINGVNTIIEKMGDGTGGTNKDYTEILNLIYEKLGDIKDTNHEDFLTIITMLANRDNIDLEDLKAFLADYGDRILAAIKDHDVHVTIDPSKIDVNVEVECQCSHTTEEGKNEGIKDAAGLVSFGTTQEQAEAMIDFTNILCAKSRVFNIDNSATGINNLNTNKNDYSTKAYDSSGREVDPRNKGLIIINGKKYYNK